MTRQLASASALENKTSTVSVDDQSQIPKNACGGDLEESVSLSTGGIGRSPLAAKASGVAF